MAAPVKVFYIRHITCRDSFYDLPRILARDNHRANAACILCEDHRHIIQSIQVASTRSPGEKFLTNRHQNTMQEQEKVERSIEQPKRNSIERSK